MDKTNLLAPVLMVSLVFAVGGFVAVGQPFDNQETYTEMSSDAQLTDNIDAGAYNIKVYLNGEQVADTHNVLMEGENAIQQAIGQGSGIAYDDIAVGNGTAPTDDSGSLDSQWGSCGLSPQQGNYEDTSAGQFEGSWNYSVTYDVTCDNIEVSTTAIFDAGSTDSNYDYFAGADLGRTINPYAGDQLTIEWSHSADDSTQ